MACTATDNADRDGETCRSGEDGEACAICTAQVEARAAYWLRQLGNAPRAYPTLTAEQLDQELIDSGRGHLARGGW